MKKRGFTLIELLAVIVILAIIALIATPIILNMINNARKSAAVDSAYGYIEAVEYNNSMNMINKDKYSLIEDGEDIDISTITNINVKGTKPDSGKISISKKRVVNASLCISGYTVEYDSKKAEVTGKCNSKENSDIDESLVGKVYEFDYTGNEQILTIPANGIYLLETWGAQGGTIESDNKIGGYGGYSTGKIQLKKDDILYLQVGGTSNNYVGGYNGGGNANVNSNYNNLALGGGGATHIATKSGLLKELSEDIPSILIVSGGGGGVSEEKNAGGSAGGYIGVDGIGLESYYGYGGTQTAGGMKPSGSNDATVIGGFGYGSNAENLNGASGKYWAGGGGAGFYGGSGGAWISSSGARAGSGGGGSSYIGNASLKEKAMYCYNCKESNEEATKTISTTNASETPISNYAKKGNGYVKITYVGK